MSEDKKMDIFFKLKIAGYTLLTIVSIILFCLISYIIYVSSLSEDIISKQSIENRQQIKSMQESQMKSLSEYGWSDKSKNIVKIPIDEAIKNVVNTYNR